MKTDTPKQPSSYILDPTNFYNPNKVTSVPNTPNISTITKKSDILNLQIGSKSIPTSPFEENIQLKPIENQKIKNNQKN